MLSSNMNDGPPLAPPGLACRSLVKLLVLPTLQSEGASGMSGPAGTADVAAAHAAMALWALTANPATHAWARHVAAGKHYLGFRCLR